jgi:hypothetical protein
MLSPDVIVSAESYDNPLHKTPFILGALQGMLCPIHSNDRLISKVSEFVNDLPVNDAKGMTRYNDSESTASNGF